MERKFAKKSLSFLLSLGLTSVCLYSSNKIYSAIGFQKEYPIPKSFQTPLKNQGNSGYCWAYAGIATLETFLAKNNLFTDSLSENHLAQWSIRRDNPFGWNIGPHDGGTSLTVIGYLASGDGPKYESDYPSRYCVNCADKHDSDPKIRVSGIKYVDVNKSFEETISNVKQAIIEYGAVSSGYGTSFHGHAISIVGWSDSRKAWVVKDSLTKSYRNLPYNTPGLLRCCINYSITEVKEREKDEKIHQHDNFASVIDVGHSSLKTCLDFANVFTFNGAEKLKSVMFKTDCAGAKYKISYAPTVNGVPDTDKSHWKLLSSGKVPYRGYISSDVDEKFIPMEGKGAIVVSIDNNEEASPATIGCECSYLGLEVPQINGRSYFIDDESAKDILTFDQVKNNKISAFSIKAITSQD